ncbi:sigma-70 family RNA polymerase sigma factor [Clostridium sp. NSJ-6]|uniref:Sigma-70 family RNA polymerase sigma factor n=1 Tax=Clostridium hominis TaxID=2763036 RepID=A0ABR7DFB7_9CLOT|nr:sigma-70 family RNA polymerase sigma factor [Clostridium hominis]MBC5630086.1 sigma-70 family RNA polymerase sigma factor [Clostridium hominis]
MLKLRGKTLEIKFEECVTCNKEKFYRLAYTYVKNSHDAMDILQESILKGYSNLSKVKDIRALDKWMSRIIVNTALDFLRKSSKETVIDKESIIVDKVATTADENLSYAIDALDPGLKTIIILKYFHGYTINEVADILEISVSTVKNRMHKALSLLRVDIKEV